MLQAHRRTQRISRRRAEGDPGGSSLHPGARGDLHRVMAPQTSTGSWNPRPTAGSQARRPAVGSQPPRPAAGSLPPRPAWGHGPPDLCGVMAPQTHVGTPPPGPTVVSRSGEGSWPPRPAWGHGPPVLHGVTGPPGPAAVRGRKLMELGLGHRVCLREKTEQSGHCGRRRGLRRVCLTGLHFCLRLSARRCAGWS